MRLCVPQTVESAREERRQKSGPPEGGHGAQLAAKAVWPGSDGTRHAAGRGRRISGFEVRLVDRASSRTDGRTDSLGNERTCKSGIMRGEGPEQAPGMNPPVGAEGALRKCGDQGPDTAELSREGEPAWLAGPAAPRETPGPSPGRAAPLE